MHISEIIDWVSGYSYAVTKRHEAKPKTKSDPCGVLLQQALKADKSLLQSKCLTCNFLSGDGQQQEVMLQPRAPRSQGNSHGVAGHILISS